MKIAALGHTELLKDPTQPFSVDVPSSAVFRAALLALGQPSLIAGITGTVYPVVIMSFSHDPDRTERQVRWYRLVAGPVEFEVYPQFLAQLWEQHPPEPGKPPRFPSPVLLYEVDPPAERA